MNRFERNHARKQIEKLKLKNLSLSSGQVIWALLGTALLPTLIGSYFCYGYIMRYAKEKKANKDAIKELEAKAGNKYK